MKDTFTLWGVQSLDYDLLVCTETTRSDARHTAQRYNRCRVVKLECRIVPRKSKPKIGKYPNDNFGLPAGYKPHNPDSLTREQVGEGFRLLADVEIDPRRRPFDALNMGIDAWDQDSWQGENCGWHTSATYRVPINTPLDINPELKTK